MYSPAFGGPPPTVGLNTQGDVNVATAPLVGRNSVPMGRGDELIADEAQPIDNMAPQDAADDTASSHPEAESDSDPSDGNGPDAVMDPANNKMQLPSPVAAGTPGSWGDGDDGQAGDDFEPILGNSPSRIYPSPWNSVVTFTDAADRGEEATVIRDNGMTPPAKEPVLRVAVHLNPKPSEGDLSDLTAAGQGRESDQESDQESDPGSFSTGHLYRSDWTTDVQQADDDQLITQAVLDGTAAVDQFSGSPQDFGNDGAASADGFSGGGVYGGANDDLGYVAAANGYGATQSEIFLEPTITSDHLPNVAGYTFAAAPELARAAMFVGGACVLLIRLRRNTVPPRSGLHSRAARFGPSNESPRFPRGCQIRHRNLLKKSAGSRQGRMQVTVSRAICRQRCILKGNC